MLLQLNRAPNEVIHSERSSNWSWGSGNQSFINEKEWYYFAVTSCLKIITPQSNLMNALEFHHVKLCRNEIQTSISRSSFNFKRHVFQDQTAITKWILDIEIKDQTVYLKVTDANLKLSLHVCVHIKIMPWKFRILNSMNSRHFYP